MYICPTLQDELRLSHGLFQPSLWYLPHPDLCIITSCHGQRDAFQIQHTYQERQGAVTTTYSCKCSHTIHEFTYPQQAGVCQRGPKRSRPRLQSSGWWAGLCLAACQAESAEVSRGIKSGTHTHTVHSSLIF